jgi:hypothetical protein
MGMEPWFSMFLVKNSMTHLSDHQLFDGSLILGFSPNRYPEPVFP